MKAKVSAFPGGRVHMIGVGGSSMSGLAGLLCDEGYRVSGSDRTRSHKTDHLAEKGVTIFIGQKAENVHGADIVVYSAAISPDNPERAEARRLGIPEIERCDLLGELMESSTCAVCVSGTHGKTTATSMLAQSYLTAGADPSVHIGGELDFLGGSTRRGSGDFVCEACEYHRSFLHFSPTVAVILNIDEDHLDYYRDIDEIEDVFREFVGLTPADGWCVAWGDDARARRVAEKSGRNVMLFGIGAENDVRAEAVAYDELGHPEFDLIYRGDKLGRYSLGVSGEANLMDALATFAVAIIRHLDADRVGDALAHFVGAHRRNELTSVTDGVKVFTDYGHNPAEIRNALSIARLVPHKTLWSVFQPHTYSRTKTLFQGFLETFDDADEVLITDICAARESDPGDIHSTMFLEPLRARGVKVHYTPTFDDAEAYLRAHWQPGDVVISHGCGDINLLNEQIALHGDSCAKKGEK